MPLPPGTDNAAVQAAGEPDPDRSAGEVPGPPGELGRRLHGWRHPAILAAAGLSVSSGFAQFLVSTTLPDVAAAFGQPPVESGSLAAQAGLSGTMLGLGLGAIRLASLAALPLSGLADRLGRRRVVLTVAALGLCLSAAAALSPSYWWFVAAAAASRPLMSSTTNISGVIAAEETRTRDRAWAIALVTAGYGVGAGSSGLLRGVFSGLGFRPLYALCLVPLLALPLLARWVEEPARFDRVRTRTRRGPPLLERLPRSGILGARLRLLSVLFFALSFLTGPVNTYLFLYGERVLGMPRSASAVAILGAAPLGAAGLLLGRFAADRVGRIRTITAAHVLVVAAGVLTYSGTPAALLAGYFVTILSASSWGIPFGAMSAELFPTSIRSTVAGALTAVGVVGAVSGLVAFGVLGDALGSFGLAAWAVALPVLAVTPLFRRLPETSHLELEQSAPEA